MWTSGQYDNHRHLQQPRHDGDENDEKSSPDGNDYEIMPNDAKPPDVIYGDILPDHQAKSFVVTPTPSWNNDDEPVVYSVLQANMGAVSHTDDMYANLSFNA